jgi:hypothetical protein
VAISESGFKCRDYGAGSEEDTMKGWNTIAVALFASFFWVLIPFSSMADMMPLGDDDLDKVEASAGVSMSFHDVTFDIEIESIEYTDTDTGNSIEFNTITVHDGEGNPVYFDSGESALVMNIFTLDDAVSPYDGRTVFSYVNNDWTQKLVYEVENFVFADQDLGVLEVGNIDMPNYHVYSLHGESEGGYAFEFGMEMGIEEIKWTYNTSPTSLNWKGVNFAQSATGNPIDPSSWVFSGEFLIGDINEINGLAEINFTTIGPSPHEIIDLPMDGTIRIEDLDFAGQDFGPMAIDGITVHSLQIQIPPI